MKWVRLGEILSLEYGDSLPEYKRITGKYPIMGSNGVVGYHNTFLIRSPAIIVGRKGSAGKVNYIDQDCYPIDTTYFVQLKTECSLKFIYYVLTNLQLEHLKTGGGVPGLNREHVYQILIPLPPLKEQHAIATFLDHKCAKIVACIAKKTRMLALLKEYKQALISKITTKGLNPQEHFKPSGVAWLGDIPGHWGLIPLGRIFKIRDEINKDRAITLILSLVKDIGVLPYSEKGNIGNKAKADLSQYQVVRSGDLVLNKMNAVIGSLGVSNYDGLVSPIYLVLFIQNKNLHLMQYYASLFASKALQQSLGQYAYGIMKIRESIDFMSFKQMLLPLPPLKEQHAIAAFLDHRLAKLDTLITKLQTQIQDLKDYKSALISEAVLGQIPLKAKHAKIQ
ncbi:restriction endonuclease subunit S [Helicobacter suis]|uniref:restriction endonuclease subunit S n=1 Tax=Helicobacter suis TaxID=104628 RepID=UPI001F434E08|nr:restriction endonuclease subunit S [Helicobacter suis]